MDHNTNGRSRKTYLIMKDQGTLIIKIDAIFKHPHKIGNALGL